MLLFTYQTETETARAGYLLEGRAYDLDAALAAAGQAADGPLRRAGGVAGLIAAGLLGDVALARIAGAPGPAALDPAGLRYLPPAGRPGAVIGVGRNYGAHAAEVGPELQQEPRLFVKLSGSVIGHGAPILRPAGVVKLDWEAEVGVIVGATLKHATEAEALAGIAGYTPLNDVTAREFQFDRTPGQTTFAKSHDTFCPVGPAMLVAGPGVDHAGFTVRSRVNDAPMQEGRTDDLLFPIPYILSFVSRYVTLRPGDIVATGTPAGIGHFRDPSVYLMPGDTVQVEIDGLPPLVNRVVDAGKEPRA